MDRHESLPELIGRLAGDITSFVEAKLGLLQLEIELRLRAQVRRALLYGAAACLGLVALLIASLAMGFWVSALLQRRIVSADSRHALAFTIVALVELSAAAGLAWAARRAASRSAAMSSAAGSTTSTAEPSLALYTRKSP